MIENRKKRLLATALLFVIGVGMVLVGIGIVAVDHEEISLEDIRKNPENHLEIEENGLFNLNASKEIYAEFTMVKITLRPDPHNRLWKTYYLVYINDTFGYELSFVISEDDLTKYQEYVGETVLFKLNISIGHEIVPPAHLLVTNILAVKEDTSLGFIYYVFIFLVGPAPVSAAKLLPNYLLAVGASTAAAGGILFATQVLRRPGRPSPCRLSFKRAVCFIASLTITGVQSG